MLDKVVIAFNRKSAVIVFDTHSVTLHSDKDVVPLVYDIVINPSIQVIKREEERQRRYASSLEDTIEIDLNDIDKDVA